MMSMPSKVNQMTCSTDTSCCCCSTDESEQKAENVNETTSSSTLNVQLGDQFSCNCQIQTTRIPSVVGPMTFKQEVNELHFGKLIFKIENESFRSKKIPIFTYTDFDNPIASFEDDIHLKLENLRN